MGTIINALGVFVAALIGLALKSKLSKNMTSSLKNVMGLVLLLMSLGWFLRDFFVLSESGLDTQLELEILLLMILGVFIGTWINIDGRFHTLLHNIEKKYKLPPMAEGFITASLIFTVGAIAIIGVFNDVINGDMTLLLVKTVLDFITAMILASTLGYGVIFSSISVLLYQGIIMIIAYAFAPVINETMMLYITLLGNVMIVAIALDFLDVKSFRVLNMLPSIVIGIIYVVIV